MTSVARSSRRTWCCKDGSQASDALAAELQDFVRQQIAPYKYPRAIRFLPSLPRTETGKLQRFKLRTDTP